MSNGFPHGHHGRQDHRQRYNDQSICTFLMFKKMFSLTLQAMLGLLNSLFEPLCSPDYNCVSKYALTVKVAYRQRITDLVIDKASLKVCGDGE